MRATSQNIGEGTSAVPVRTAESAVNRPASNNRRNVGNATPKMRKSTDAAGARRKTSSEQKDSIDKELKHMSRSELIEVIYALEQDNQSLQKENKKLQAELNDKDIRIETSGSIAEAALSLNHIFEDAQAAADQYLYSVKRAASAAAQRGGHAL